MLLSINKKVAERLGLLGCQSCGWLKNQHFVYGKKMCAHSAECKGYKESCLYGKIVKKRK